MYAQVPVTEKVWITLGPECGKGNRTTAMIVQSLYGISVVGAALEATLLGA